MEKQPNSSQNHLKQGFSSLQELEQSFELGMISSQEEYELRKQKLIEEAGLSDIQSAYELGMVGADEYRLRMKGVLGGELQAQRGDSEQPEISPAADLDSDKLLQYEPLRRRATILKAQADSYFKKLAQESSVDYDQEEHVIQQPTREFINDVIDSNLTDDQKRELFKIADIKIIDSIIQGINSEKMEQSNQVDSYDNLANFFGAQQEFDQTTIDAAREFIETKLTVGFDDAELKKRLAQITADLGKFDDQLGEACDDLKTLAIDRFVAAMTPLQQAEISVASVEDDSAQEKKSAFEKIFKLVPEELKRPLKKAVAFALALVSTTGIAYGALKYQDEGQMQDVNSDAIVLTEAYDGSAITLSERYDDNDSQFVESLTEQQAQTERSVDQFQRWEEKYEAYKRGELKTIEYDAEILKAALVDKPEYNMFTRINSLEDLGKAGIISPEVTVSLLSKINTANAYYMDDNGELAVAKTPIEYNKSIADSKIYPEIYTKNYESFMKLIKDGEASVTERYVAPKTFNVYTVVVNRATGETALAFGQGHGGDAISFYVKDGERVKQVSFLKECANLVVTIIEKEDILIPVPITTPDPDPDPDPKKYPPESEKEEDPPKEEEKENPPTDDPEPDKPSNPSNTNEEVTPPVPKPTPELEAKDFDQLPDNNEQVISDGKATGQNKMEAGELKPEQSSTKETIQEQIMEQQAGEQQVDQATKKQAEQNIKQEQQTLDQKMNEQLNNSQTDQPNIIESANPQAEKAVEELHEQVVKDAGEAEPGVNPQIDGQKLYDQLQELNRQGVKPEDVQIVVDPEDGSVNAVNNGMVDMP